MFAVMGHASMREAVASGTAGSNARCTRWKHELRNRRKEVRSRSNTPRARRSLRSAERRETDTPELTERADHTPLRRKPGGDCS